MNLQNLQVEFIDSIFSNTECHEFVKPHQHMLIYKKNIVTTLTNTLFNIYPLLVKLIGKDFFHLTAQEYIQCYPSRSSNLHDYGEYFSHFLATYSPLQDLVYLPEVAAVEWICHSLSFAAEPSPFNIKQLENIASEEYDSLHFTLHPACKMLKCDYPILRIIELCQGNLQETIDVMSGGMHLLIIRRNLEIALIPISLADYTFLNALNDNKPLSQALDETIAIEQNFQLNEKLTCWIQTQIITDFNK